MKAKEEIEELNITLDNEERKESNIIPKMDITSIVEKENIVSDETLLGVYEEVLSNLREDRKEVSDMIDNMANLVINDGDATTSSKEALVNLLKIKTDIADKKAKIADLMTRVKLKEKDTFPKYLAAQQNNTIKIETSEKKKKEFMRIIEEAKNG